MSGSGGVKFNVRVFVNSQTFNRFTGQKAQEELLWQLRQLKLSTLHTHHRGRNTTVGSLGSLLHTNDRHIAFQRVNKRLPQIIVASERGSCSTHFDLFFLNQRASLLEPGGTFLPLLSLWCRSIRLRSVSLSGRVRVTSARLGSKRPAPTKKTGRTHEGKQELLQMRGRSGSVLARYWDDWAAGFLKACWSWKPVVFRCRF